MNLKLYIHINNEIVDIKFATITLGIDRPSLLLIGFSNKEVYKEFKKGRKKNEESIIQIVYNGTQSIYFLAKKIDLFDKERLRVSFIGT